MEQLRLRFQFFTSAMQFNLMPENQLLSPNATLVKKLRDAIHQLKLRCGLRLLLDAKSAMKFTSPDFLTKNRDKSFESKPYKKREGSGGGG
ncbi:hypothetical protein GOBAR_DD21155 [Gossypium barbadense]|nr:hypothetical protein GOBAR_DD21155 [Gossypium barbadense]